MTTKTWDAFFPYVLPSVPGCDEDTATFYIRQAAIEFCANSQAWKQELSIPTVADQSNYTIPYPTGSALSKLDSFTLVDLDGVPNDDYEAVSAKTGRSLDRNFSDSYYVYLSEDAATLIVMPSPDESGASVLPYVTLKPSQTSAGVPDWLFEQYVDAIAQGALSKLMGLPGKAWSNPGLSTVKGDKADKKAGGASVRESRGKARARTRSKAFLF